MFAAAAFMSLLSTSSVDVEVVFERHVLRDRAAVLLRGREAYVLRGRDGLLGQAVGQALDDAYALHGAGGRENRAQANRACDVVLARLFGEAGFGLRRDDCLARHLGGLECASVILGRAASAASRPAASLVRVAAARVVAVTRPVARPVAVADPAARAVAHTRAPPSPRRRDGRG